MSAPDAEQQLSQDVSPTAQPLPSSPSKNTGASVGSPKSSPGKKADSVTTFTSTSQTVVSSNGNDSGSAGDASMVSTASSDSISIRCNILTPSPSPPPPNAPPNTSTSSGRVFKTESAKSPLEDGEILDLPQPKPENSEDIKTPGAPMQNYVPLPDIDLTGLVGGPPSSSISLPSLNANATQFIPSGAFSPSSTTPTEDESGRTPNVYINGLPPHFPEDQLFNLAAPFGGVKSVRTFTRHIGDRESGYGFVLFDTVDSAERCITSLRRYRNLHPTFSKQIHKIPGTQYATSASFPSLSTLQSSDSLAYSQQKVPQVIGTQNQRTNGETFKDRMERLHDHGSTNLYIEGLPLSIDEPTLAALVSPHTIKSSRFFQTRLSNPPRIIAFVRLDTRDGAEEIIERLHGRMVRGWNDPGSRISVRFADTSEQRELRRNERACRDGDASPARLTIAQAALLNLRGQDLSQPSMPRSPQYGTAHQQIFQPEYPIVPDHRPVVGSGYNGMVNSTSASSLFNQRGIPNSTSFGSSLASAGGFDDFASNVGHLGGSYPSIGSSNSNGNIFSNNGGSRDREFVNPHMAALLENLRGSENAAPFVPAQQQQRRGNDMLNLGSQLGDMNLQDALHSSQVEQSNAVYQHPNFHGRRAGGGAAIQTKNGYTPTEEYILQAHSAQRKQAGAEAGAPQRGLRSSVSSSQIGMGMRGVRTQGAHVIASPSMNSEAGGMSPEEEFHAASALGHGRRGSVSSSGQGHMRGGSREFKAYLPSPALHAQARMAGMQSQPHIRSSTLPHPSSNAAGGDAQQKHQQRSSLSIQPISSSHGLGTLNNNKHNNNHSNKHFDNDSHSSSHNHQQQHRSNQSIGTRNNNSTNNDTGNHTNMIHGNNNNKLQPRPINTSAANEEGGHAGVSPTLSYGSRGTPSTLSPATPAFFGTFGDGFNGSNAEGGGFGAGRKGPGGVVEEDKEVMKGGVGIERKKGGGVGVVGGE